MFKNMRDKTKNFGRKLSQKKRANSKTKKFNMQN